MPIRQLSAVPSDSTAPYTITYSDIQYVWLGPQNTRFDPPASCNQITTLGSQGLYIYDFENDANPTCWPSISGSIQITTTPGVAWTGYYSPATCPSSWTNAATTSSNFFGTASGYAVICCPSNFQYEAISGNPVQQCYSPVAGVGNPVLSNIWIPSETGVLQSTFLGTLSNPLTTVSLTADTHVACSPISVSWETTDLTIMELAGLTTTQPPTQSSTPTTNTSKSSSSSPTSSTTPPPTQTTTPPSPSSISTGAKIGIAVTVVVAACAIFLGVFFYFRRKGKLQGVFKKSENDQLVPPGTHELETKENTHELGTKDNSHELLGNSFKDSLARKPVRNELDVEPDIWVPELDGRRSRSSMQDGEESTRRPSPAMAPKKSFDGRLDGGRIDPEQLGPSKAEEEKLARLKERIEKIRKEKESLRRILELEELEEATTQQITEATRLTDGRKIQDLEEQEETVKREILDAELKRNNTRS